MAKQEKHLLPIDKKTLIDSVFPSRITTQNRTQTSYDHSLIFPVSLILSLANQAESGDFNKSLFLKKVSENVVVWYKPLKDFSHNPQSCNENDNLKHIRFGEILEIFPEEPFDGKQERHILIKTASGYGIVYNPPLLTPTIRKIAEARGTYIHDYAPISIKDRTQLQLDHTVPIAAWLSAQKSDDKEYRLLNKIVKKLKDVECDGPKISVKKVQEQLDTKTFENLKEECLVFMSNISDAIDNLKPDEAMPPTFRLQLIDSRHNHSKIYTESTILAKTVKKLAGIS